MGDLGPTPSRRSFLSGFAFTSAALAAAPAVNALDREFAVWGDQPITLARTEQGRSDSEFRYRNAEAFFRSIEAGLTFERKALLYHTGIVMQLVLSSHLLDVGFQDGWCARHIGLRVAKSLAYANATGLGHRGPEVEHLAERLTPYSKWRNWSLRDETELAKDTLGRRDITRITRELLDHVRRVTGHSRSTTR